MASIKRRANGAWRARYRDGEGKEHAAHFARRADAQRWIDEQTAAIVTGTYVSPTAGKVTFKDYATGWAAARVERPATTRVISSTLRLHVLPRLGDLPIGSIRPSHVQGVVSAMVANGLAPKTVERAYTFVAAIMKAAVHDRVLPSSPCVGISLPRVGNPEVTIPTVETVEALAAAVGDHYRPFVVFLAGSGLRVSEAFALRTSDIDWLRRTVKVSKQAGRHGEDVPPKSSASVRTVPLAQCVIDELAASIAAREVETDHLFVDPDGRPLDHHSWGEVWRKAREVVGTTVRTHDLRHLYASALINGGCSVKSVQTVLGHASAAITLRTYAHVWPGDEDRTRNVIEKALRGLSRTPRGLDDHSADNTAGQTAVALVK